MNGKMGCEQGKQVVPANISVRPKSVKFRDPPEDYIDAPYKRPDTAVRPSRRPQSADDIYPPRPPKTKRKDIIQDDSMFQNVDDRALLTPKPASGSVESLCSHLTDGMSDDMMKCRAFYRWITDNISYDTAATFQGKKKPTDPESVLRLRTTVCTGYSNLFAALCRSAGITVETICGYSKGYDYDPEVPYVYGHATNHSWNAVHVNGDWRLVECSWGAGHIDENKKYHFDYSDCYFFMDPDQFIHSHYPFVRNEVELALCWQLLETTWSIEEFNKNVKPSSKALEWGIQFPSHKSTVFFVNGLSHITVRCPKTLLYVVSADLTPEKGDRTKSYCFVKRKSEREYSVTIRPPNIGKYTLRILGSAIPNDDDAECLTSYLIKCAVTDGVVRPYPYHWGAWGLIPDFMSFGLAACNKESDPYISPTSNEVSLVVATDRLIEAGARMSHAEEIVKNCDDYVMLESSENALHVKARLPREGFYKLKLLVKVEETNYVAVTNILLECKVAQVNCKKFPKCYKTAREYFCRLLEPQVLELPNNTLVSIKMKSPKVKHLVLKKQQVKQKPENGVWEFTSTTPSAGEKFLLAGNDSAGTHKGLYEFIII
ncbi:hypothetical protein FSP39_022128 [Pinctada imbricata]|uniref:Transglutaminase-like domain-containing protein n=1 Tax=Pinctada imbricata TaxID=66713 RepID=A0AA88Y7Z7_PINIB|nr:hypothetical protein FSP39_022128 [Pinctada imbricata]